MHINLSVKDNFSSFVDKKSGLTVFIDSFDNMHFDIRIGTVNESILADTILAETDSELNKRVTELLDKYQSDKRTLTNKSERKDTHD